MINRLLCFMWGHEWHIKYVPGSDQRLYTTFCKHCGKKIMKPISDKNVKLLEYIKPAKFEAAEEMLKEFQKQFPEIADSLKKLDRDYEKRMD